MPRPATSRPRSSGWSTRASRARDRGLLPDQRAVARARGHAGARADRLPGHRRDEVLRARRDQGRDRVPHVPGQPAGRGGVHADRELAAAGHRADVAEPRAGLRRRRGHPGVGGRRGRRAGPHRRRAQGDRALHEHDGAAARAGRERRAGRQLLQETLGETDYLEVLKAERTIEAQGRIENLEELVERGARVRRERRGPRRSRSSSSRSRCCRTPMRCATTRAS